MVFISYRRNDSQNATGRILDRLKETFKTEEVFMDVESIPHGVNFLDFTRRRMEGSEIAVIIIGKSWAKSLKERERDTNDFVRIEIEQALKQGLPMLPVYVDGAISPGTKDLPESIKEFAYFNGINVRPNPDFDQDMIKLTDSLKKIVSSKALKPKKRETSLFDRLKLIMIGAALIIGLITYLVTKKVCDSSKTGILIANFQEIEHDGFSNSLMAKLDAELSDSLYDVHTVGYQPRDKENYKEYVEENFFETTCTPQGLFVNGFLSKEQKVFNLYTSLVGMKVKLPDFISDESLKLNNPPYINFSIKEDVDYISDLLLAILRIYEGNINEALDKLAEVEKEGIEDKELLANLAFFKGQCYAVNGDEKMAEVFFKAAQKTDNVDLFTVARKNQKVAPKIGSEYQKTPESAEIRRQNIQNHKKLESEISDFLRKRFKKIRNIPEINKVLNALGIKAK